MNATKKTAKSDEVEERWSTMLRSLSFDLVDREIFSIEDEKTRAHALQRYFFPKLLILLNSSSSLILKIYGESSLDNFTETRRPKPKEGGSRVSPFDDVHVGLIGVRVPDGLRLKSTSGKAIEYGISSLYFNVLRRGTIAVTFRPIGYGDDRAFEAKVSTALAENSEAFETICHAAFVTSDAAMALDTFKSALSPEHLRRGRFFSSGIDFPVSSGSGLKRLAVTFALLFPFQRMITDMSMGLRPSLPHDLQALLDWWGPDRLELFAPERANIPMEELKGKEADRAATFVDSAFAVSGRQRWRIFERDDFRCVSCGRFAEPGNAIFLQVDHILPRSLGGTDDDENLQTLCSECNLGKGDTSSRDLRTRLSD